MNARKILVERPILDEFVKRLTAKVRTLKCGNPSTPGAVVGTLMTDLALQGVKDRVSEAVALGANVVIGEELTVESTNQRS